MTKIDDGIESLARDVLNAVVKKDPDRMAGALRAFPDENAMTEGYRLALAVALFVVQDQYHSVPDSVAIRALAEKAAELEDWTDITADEFATLLEGAYSRTRLDQLLPLDRVVLISYVLAGDLLAGFCKPGEWWYDYLDRAEAVIEATS